IRHATEAPRPLKELNASVPDGLQHIVSRMLAKDPAQRYATPGQAAQALQAFLVAGQEPPSGENDPKLRSYLTWLETEGNGRATKSERAVPQASGVAAPAPPRRLSRKPKRQRSRTAVGLPD